MKKSFFEDFLSHLGKSKQKNRILATVALSLAVVVFLGAYMLVSQNAMAEEAGDMDKLEKSSDVVTLQESDDGTANDPYATGSDTDELVDLGDGTNGILGQGKPELNLPEEELGNVLEPEEDLGNVLDEEPPANELIMEEEPVTPYPLQESNIETVTVKRKDGNNGFVDLVDGKVYADDEISMEIAFAVQAGEMGDGQNTIQYKLPVGIALNKELNAPITIKNSSGVKVEAGTIHINKQGLVTIEIDEAKLQYTKGFTGSFDFMGKIDSSNLTEGDQIGIGEDYTITLAEKETPSVQYGIDGNKSYKQVDGKVVYTVQVNSQNGTNGEPITIADSLQKWTGRVDGDYELASFKITDKDSQKVNAEPDINNEAVPSNFTLELPALEKNGGYIIEYTVDPEEKAMVPSTDGSTSISNKVVATSGKSKFESSQTTGLHSSKLKKEHRYNETTGEITWTITINADEDGLQGYILKDVMTANNVEVDVEAFENLKLKKPADTIVENISMPYTFGNDCKAAGAYIVTYTTNVKDILPANQNGNVNNTATLEKGDESYEAGTGVGTSYTTYDLVKDYVEKDNEANTYSWKSTITVPKDDEDITGQMVYVDTLQKVVANNDHYTTVEDLNNMVVKVDGEVTTDYTIWCKSFAPSVKTYSWKMEEYETKFENPAPSKIKLTNFKLTFTRAFLKDHNGENITIEYDSYINPDGLKTNTTYKVKNTATVGKKSDMAETEVSKDKPFTKLVKGTGNSYVEGLSGVSYDALLNGDGNAILSYRIDLNMNMLKENQIELTDVLPTGATLVDDSLDARFAVYKKDGSNQGNIWQVQLQNAPKGKRSVTAPECVSAQCESGTVTFTIANPNQYADYFKPYENIDHVNVWFTYQIILPKPDDPAWEGDPEKNFVNSLTCDGVTVENTANVVHKGSYLSKTGQQAEGSYDTKYTLVINKAGATLNPNQGNGDNVGKVELVDTLKITNGNAVTAELPPNGVKLYYYSNGVQGDLVPVDQYSYTTAESGQTYTITMTIPDGTAFLMEYTYEIYNPNKQTPTIYNTAKLANKSVTQVGSNIKLDILDISANLYQAIATVYKHEAGNEGKPLERVVFEIQKYNGETFEAVNETIQTDENGEILLSFIENGDYQQDTLYRLTEKETLTGYKLDTTPRYFAWSENGASGIARPADVAEKDIVIFSLGNTRLKFPNTPIDSIVVTKQWLKPDGVDEMDTKPDITIGCEIFQFGVEKDALVKAFTLSNEDGWSKEFKLTYREDGNYADDELPMYDANGMRYKYSVVETNIPEDFMANYLTQIDEGITHGELVIQNIQIAYTLPETGGLGTAIPMVAGLLIITLATTLILYRKKRTA